MKLSPQPGSAAGPLAGQAYDHRLSSVYDEGQAHEPETFELWMQRFRRHAGEGGVKAILDLGSGTGRFDPALAEAFGSYVFGVEPSQDMRAIAERLRPHPRVTYLDGSAESIPLPDHSCDLALMFLVLQHISDRPASAMELGRVLKPGGRLLIAGRFRGEPTPRAWARYFPRANEIEEKSLPTAEETKVIFSGAGLELLTLDRIRIRICGSLATYLERIKLRPISSLQHLSDKEFRAGVAALEADVAREVVPKPVLQDADLMVFHRLGA